MPKASTIPNFHVFILQRITHSFQQPFIPLNFFLIIVTYTLYLEVSTGCPVKKITSFTVFFADSGYINLPTMDIPINNKYNF